MRKFICDVCRKDQQKDCLVPFYYIDGKASDGNKYIDVCPDCRERLDARVDKLKKDFRLLISAQMEAYLIILQREYKDA